MKQLYVIVILLLSVASAFADDYHIYKYFTNDTVRLEKAVQCIGTTQKGARCRKRTKNTSHYCTYHNLLPFWKITVIKDAKGEVKKVHKSKQTSVNVKKENRILYNNKQKGMAQ